MPRVVSLFANAGGRRRPSPGTSRALMDTKQGRGMEAPQRRLEAEQSPAGPSARLQHQLKNLQTGAKGPILPHSCTQTLLSPAALPVPAAGPCCWHQAGDGKGMGTQPPPRSAPGDKVAIRAIYPPGQRQVDERPLNREFTARCHR